MQNTRCYCGATVVLLWCCYGATVRLLHRPYRQHMFLEQARSRSMFSRRHNVGGNVVSKVDEYVLSCHQRVRQFHRDITRFNCVGHTLLGASQRTASARKPMAAMRLARPLRAKTPHPGRQVQPLPVPSACGQRLHHLAGNNSP